MHTTSSQNAKRKKALSLKVEDLSTSATQLHNRLLCGYGPSFQQTLVATTTGKVLITNSGTQILRTLDSNLIEKHIIDMVTFHHRSTGDDSKSFIILLAEILKRVAVIANQRHDVQLELAQCFDEINSNILPVLLKSIEERCVQIDLSTNGDQTVEDAFADLLSCSLSGQFLEYDTRIIINLLNTVIKCWRRAGSRSLVQLFDVLIDNFPQIFHQIPGRSVSTSKIVSGLLISRGFLNNLSTDLLTDDDSIRFMLIDCPIETNIDENDTNATLSISDENCLESLIHHKRIRTEAFVQHLKLAKVSLLVTTHKLSALEKTQCSRNGITAVHCVDESEMRFLSLMCSVEVLHEIKHFTDENIGQAEAVKQLSCGSHKFTNIVMRRDIHGYGSGGVYSLLLAGPTEGVSYQTSQKILDSLKVLKQSVCEFRVMKTHPYSSSLDLISESVETLSLCSSSYKTSYSNTEAGDSGIGNDGDINLPSDLDSPPLNRHLNSSEVPTEYQHDHSKGLSSLDDEYEFGGHLSLIPAGGTFEVYLYAAITHYLTNQPPTGRLNTALTILRESLIAIPRTLHENAYYFDKQCWAHVMNTLTEEAKRGTLLGVDPVEGKPSKIQACHPFNSKCQLISNVISATRQLLRLDQIT